MPYGVDKEMGGDSPENVGWMEKCVKSVMEGGKEKSSAIAICKAQLRKKKESKSSLEDDIVIDVDLAKSEEITRNAFIHRCLRLDLVPTFADAQAMYDVQLAKANFDFTKINLDF